MRVAAGYRQVTLGDNGSTLAVSGWAFAGCLMADERVRGGGAGILSMSIAKCRCLHLVTSPQYCPCGS